MAHEDAFSKRASVRSIVRDVLSTPRLTIQLLHHARIEPFFDLPYDGDQLFLDFSLTGRPRKDTGRYVGFERARRAEPIGDVVFVLPARDFRASSAGGWQTNLRIRFYPDQMPANIDRFHEETLLEGLHLTDAISRLALWRLASEALRARLESPSLVEEMAISILERVGCYLAQVNPAARPKRGGLSPYRLRLIEDRLHADDPAPHIGELAALCDLSGRHLARAYREEKGESIGERIASVTLQRAWKLLTQSDKPIAEISCCLGFSSSANFATAFRNSVGCQPTSIRKSCRSPTSHSSAPIGAIRSLFEAIA